MEAGILHDCPKTYSLFLKIFDPLNSFTALTVQASVSHHKKYDVMDECSTSQKTDQAFSSLAEHQLFKTSTMGFLTSGYDHTLCKYCSVSNAELSGDRLT
jgi:hypothetical protein